jgi:hypothetical protein
MVEAARVMTRDPKSMSDGTITLAQKVMATILATIQGPCKDNQRMLTNSSFFDVLY